jgi:two-component system sensor histidine kinase UhpB
VPLVYRVAGINALVLVATVAVTLVVLAPRKFSSFALDEAVVLTASLVLVALVNLTLLRRIVRPLETLTSLARRVDLTRPGARMPGASATSEAGELALTFNEMLARLETERREATGRVLEAQESERLRIALELHDQVGQELTGGRAADRAGAAPRGTGRPRAGERPGSAVRAFCPADRHGRHSAL